MAEHKVGGQVVLTGTIVALEGGIALVEVSRSFPAGGTITVRLGTLPNGEESDEDLIRRAMAKAVRRPGREVTVGADGKVTGGGQDG